MEEEDNNKTHSHLSGIVSQLNDFCIIPSQTLTPSNSLSIFHESNSLHPKEIGNNMIFLFQECDTFHRTKKERAWLVGVTSQCHPEYTQLIWSFSIKIHFIHSQQLNYLRDKAIPFGRNSHLLVSNHLCFKPSEPNPLLPAQGHLGTLIESIEEKE